MTNKQTDQTEESIDYDRLAESMIAQLRQMNVGRREMLAALTGAGAGAAGLYSLMGRAEAQTNPLVLDGVDQIGRSSDPVSELYVDTTYYTDQQVDSLDVQNGLTAGSVDTDELDNTPQMVTLQKDSNETISANTNTTIAWDSKRGELNANVDLSAYVDTASNGFTVPSSPDFSAIRLTVSITTGSPVLLELLQFSEDGTPTFDGNAQTNYDRANMRTEKIQSRWIPISGGETFTTTVKFDSQININKNARTFFSLEVR
jgi:hypothetical protein